MKLVSSTFYQKPAIYVSTGLTTISLTDSVFDDNHFEILISMENTFGLEMKNVTFSNNNNNF